MYTRTTTLPLGVLPKMQLVIDLLNLFYFQYNIDSYKRIKQKF